MKYTTPLLAACLVMSTVTSAAPVPLDGRLGSSPLSRRQASEATEEAFIPLLLRRDDVDADDANEAVLYRRLGGLGRLFGKGASKALEKGVKEGGKKGIAGWSRTKKWGLGLTAGVGALGLYAYWSGKRQMNQPPPGAAYPGFGQAGGPPPAGGGGVGVGGGVVPDPSMGAGSQFTSPMSGGYQYAPPNQQYAPPPQQYAAAPQQYAQTPQFVPQQGFAVNTGVAQGLPSFQARSADDSILRREPLIDLEDKRDEGV